MCTGHKVASKLPQGCVPQNYAILWFAYLLPLHYLVVLHSALSLNNGIVTLIGVIFHVSKVDTLSNVLGHHKIVFDEGLGNIKCFRADIKLQDGAKPIFC